MAILEFGAGSTLVDQVRRDLAGDLIPNNPHFLVRLSHNGPAALTTLSLDLDLLLLEPLPAVNGTIVFPIQENLTVGQYLGWSVFAGFDIPKVAAYLVINGGVTFLRRKENLKAKGLWSNGVELTALHLREASQ